MFIRKLQFINPERLPNIKTYSSKRTIKENINYIWLQNK